MQLLTTIYIHAVALSALAVVALHQILKFKFFPSQLANKYPVPTLIVLSVLASLFVAWRGIVVPHSWTDWVILVATVAVTAAITYISTIKNWAEMRQMEG